MTPSVEPTDVWEEIEGIAQQKLASELGNEFVGTVAQVVRDVKKGEFAGSPILKFTILTEEEEEVITSYRIPKAWTGRGQMDLLKSQCEKLEISIKDMLGKKFRWERMNLEGGMQGNARHYPVEILAQ